MRPSWSVSTSRMMSRMTCWSLGPSSSLSSSSSMKPLPSLSKYLNADARYSSLLIFLRCSDTVTNSSQSSVPFPSVSAASRSILISDSGTGWPLMWRPSLSSSSDRLPLWSLSIMWNICTYLSSSSTGRFRATTPSAFFLNLFIAENCCSLARTASPSDTFGAVSAFFSHGCSRTCLAVSRVDGSGSSILLTRSLALADTLGHGSRLKSRPPRRTACAIFSSLSPQNGGTPQRRM
uniref:Uncharacterized protein n=1 Tax=Arundo donax TaxID=35708 RepID=A0A0A9BNN5_ARUDO